MRRDIEKGVVLLQQEIYEEDVAERVREDDDGQPVHDLGSARLPLLLHFQLSREHVGLEVPKVNERLLDVRRQQYPVVE